MSKPRIVCLCGSTRFKKAFKDAQRRETLAGKIYLSVGMFGHLEGLDPDGEVKAMLDRLHLAKIDLADEVLVLDCPQPFCLTCAMWCMPAYEGVPGRTPCCDGELELRPYIGDSTRREIAYAQSIGKPVRYLSQESEVKSS